METAEHVNKEEELLMKMREALASRFKDFPLLVTMALWLCILPVIVIVIGWLWGFWEALTVSLAVLVGMTILCLVFCLRIKPGFKKTSDL